MRCIRCSCPWCSASSTDLFPKLKGWTQIKIKGKTKDDRGGSVTKEETGPKGTFTFFFFLKFSHHHEIALPLQNLHQNATQTHPSLWLHPANHLPHSHTAAGLPSTGRVQPWVGSSPVWSPWDRAVLSSQGSGCCHAVTVAPGTSAAVLGPVLGAWAPCGAVSWRLALPSRLGLAAWPSGTQSRDTLTSNTTVMISSLVCCLRAKQR